MRFNLVITSALVSLLVGVVSWALQPTHKAFSWAINLDVEYLAGLLPGSAASGPGIVPELSILDYAPALESLAEAVEGDYSAYATMGSMGRRLVLADGTSHPVFHEVFVTQGYFRARRVGAQHGRLPREDELGVIAIGNAYARSMFGDPRLAVGQEVELTSPVHAVRMTIVGVLEPSPAQNTKVDIDQGLVGSLAAYFAEDRGLASRTPLFLSVTFGSEAAAASLEERIAAWVADYFGPDGAFVRMSEYFSQAASARHRQLLLDIGARRTTFLAFGLALTASALAALYAQSHFHLLRRRQLLGVEKALGATRLTLARQLIGAQLPWTLLGGLMGLAALWSLHDLRPELFLTRPPASVLALALGLPLAALVALAAASSLPLISGSAMSLLRGRIKGRRLRPLLWLVYGGLALALAGGLAATQVSGQVQREVAALQAQFGAMYTIQTGAAVVDSRLERSFEEGRDLAPLFGPDDAAAVLAVEGVLQATLAQTLPRLGVRTDRETTELRAVAADGSYLAFMGLELVAGDASGCVLTQSAATSLGAAPGSALLLAGLSGPVPCQVTGLMRDPGELWSWLVLDLPELLTPPLDGLGLPLPGYLGEPFRSIRMLLKLEGPEVEQALHAWRAERFPQTPAEVIPYTPDVEELLASLRLQAEMFRLIALIAAILSVWGIVGGFIALLEAERFRIALDRALGLSVPRLRSQWWRQTLGLGALSGVVGLALGQLLSARLYSALALDIPNLPARETLALSPTLLVGVALALALLSAGLTLIATLWVTRQSSLTMLKEGAL